MILGGNFALSGVVTPMGVTYIMVTLRYVCGLQTWNVNGQCVAFINSLELIHCL